MFRLSTQPHRPALGHTRLAGCAHSIIGTPAVMLSGVLGGEVIFVAEHDHSDRRPEIQEVARELAQGSGRNAEPVVDVERWLAEYGHRRYVGALLVVWDRADAAVLEHARPDVDVCQAAPRIRYRDPSADPPDDLPRARRPDEN